MGFGVPFHFEGQASSGVEVGGVAPGDAGEGSVRGVFARGQPSLRYWMAGQPERPSSAACAVADHGYDASETLAVGERVCRQETSVVYASDAVWEVDYVPARSEAGLLGAAAQVAGF